MKKLNLLIGATLATLLSVACGTKKPEPVPPTTTTTKTKGAPLWIDNPTTVPGIIGVGAEPPNVMGDIMMQRKAALAAARSEIAKQLSIQVQGAFSGLDQQFKTAGKEGKKVISTEAMERMREDVSREVVDVALVGATPREFWTDPETNQLWVLVVLDKDASDRAIKAAASAAIRREVKTGEADLKDALGRLDATLANATNK
jgi:hypothetical protein